MAGSVNTTGKKQGPAVAPKRGAKKLNYVVALYEYTAQSDAEWSMSEGERFVLIKEDPGDGCGEGGYYEECAGELCAGCLGQGEDWESAMEV